MELTKVDVKWDRNWYPAFILRQINDDEVEVEFENPDYPLETVPISDIKAREVSLKSHPIKTVAGEFDWQYFMCFFKKMMGNSGFVTPLSVQELVEVNLKSSLFSSHASERVKERYCENMQELHRSLTANQFLAFRETRKRVFCGYLRIDCTPDLKHIISLQVEQRNRAFECSNMTLVDMSHFKRSMEAWCDELAPNVVSSLDFEACKLLGDVTTTQVITTTTRFVLSHDCSRIVTVIKLRQSFGEWRKHYERVQQRKKLKNQYKYGY